MYALVILNGVELYEESIFEKKPEGAEGVNHEYIWGRDSQAEGTAFEEVPEAGVVLVSSKWMRRPVWLH